MLRHTRARLRGARLLLALVMTACSHQPAVHGDAGTGARPRDAGAARDAGLHDAGGRDGAAQPAVDGAVRWDRACEPNPLGPADACLICLAETCCDTLGELFCGESDPYPAGDGSYLTTAYVCPAMFLDCVRACFARDTSASPDTASEQVLDVCGAQCSTQVKPYAQLRRSFLSCLSGSALPRPDADGGQDFASAPDTDGGASPESCTDACLPGWR